MKVENGKEVSVSYRLYLDGFDGELFEETNEEEPMAFMIGSGEMLTAFEAAIMGKAEGEEFELHIPCDQAYGTEKEEFYMEFPKSDFIGDDGEMDDELFEVGEVVPMTTDEGEEVYGVVVEVKLNSLIIDFNHPLADEDLYFKGKIEKIA